jgi:hypothetical protein
MKYMLTFQICNLLISITAKNTSSYPCEDTHRAESFDPVNSGGQIQL